MLMNRKLVGLGLLFVTLGLNASNQQITDLDQAFRDECVNYQELDKLPVHIRPWEREEYKKHFVLNADNCVAFPAIYNVVEKAAKAVDLPMPQVLLSKGYAQGQVYAWRTCSEDCKETFMQLVIGLGVDDKSLNYRDAYELELAIRQSLYQIKDRDFVEKAGSLYNKGAVMIWGATLFNTLLPCFSHKIYRKLGYTDQKYGVFKIGKNYEFACWSKYSAKDMAVILLVMGSVGGYLVKKTMDLIKERKAFRLDVASTKEQLASLREKNT